MSFTMLEVSGEAPVARIALNNPARKNAIGPLMVNELLHALERANADEAVRVIVLTGTGERFCAGGDLAQMSGLAGVDALEPKGDFVDLMLAMWRSPKPIVARVQGPALGGGVGLVGACHFALVADTAFLRLSEIDVGVFPMMIMAVLARVVPRRKLVEMMLLADKMTAAEAVAHGLATRAVPAAELDAQVDALCAQLAAKSPAAVRIGLGALAAQGDMDLEAALPFLRGKLAEVLATDDAREGLTAFFEERRPAKWTGK